MHSVKLFEWDTDYRIHLTLIGINVLLLVSLILRFEWPLIIKRCDTSTSDDNDADTNLLERNGVSPPERNINASPSITSTPVPNTSNPVATDEDKPIEEEKYIMLYPNVNDDKEAEQQQPQASVLSPKSKRRRESIEFYRELFNVDNFDRNGKLLTAKKRKKRKRKNKKRISYHHQNDSVNLKAHERPFNDINDTNIDDDIEMNTNTNMYMLPTTTTTQTQMFHDYDSTTNIGEILSSNIYDDEDKKAVRFRYRCILYFPCIIFMLCGIISLVLSTLQPHIGLYIYVNYGYPVLQIILSIVLWCEIDIVILSCGGAHIVEECLEVQISANGDEYKCIYCCWCNCAVLRFCNSCTHNNGFSLFKCHHTFMKILICCICPLLTVVFFIISEIPQINKPLMATTIAEIHSIRFIEIHNSSSVYWLIFMIIAILYLVFLFTATYIGILIVKSLHFVSSLSPKTLTMQYITSIIITFLMQIQFMVLLVYYNVYRDNEVIDITDKGLCSPTPFFMLLIYFEFIIAGFINHFSFRNNDFVRFGREAIEKNEVQLFDFQPDFDSIHDLHNYRRVYGPKFLWQIDIDQEDKKKNNRSFLNGSEIKQQQEDNDETALEKKKKVPKKRQSFEKQKADKKIKLNKHQEVESIELEAVIVSDDDDNKQLSATITQIKETKHNHPTTTTNSLSLDLNVDCDTIYSLDLDQDTSSSHRNIKLQTVDSEKP